MNTSKPDQSQNILILGAGELGMAMLQGFMAERISHPQIRLTVLLRESAALNASSQRLTQFSAWNIDVVTGDFSTQSEEELAAIFRPFDAVINCSGFVGGKGTQLKITRAVLQAGVARYFPWQFGVDYARTGKGSGQPVWDEQLDVRALLRQQKQTRWVIVSTGIFTSYLFAADFGVVDFPGRVVNALGDADYALTMTTPEDIGRLTAKIYFHQPEPADQIIFVSGDTLTYRQLAQVLREYMQQDFSVKVKTKAQLLAESAASPEDRAAAYRLSFARPDGVAWDKAITFNAQHSMPVTDVRNWLRNSGIKHGIHQ